MTMSQDYLMACLEKFGLLVTDCNGVDKPIASRLTVQDQQEVPNSTAQELQVYRDMVGSLLYLASSGPCLCSL